jgi:hypothetical protein
LTGRERTMARTLFRELAEIVRLEKGRHRTPQDGVCTMELVAWMAGEKHSDHPKSASPVIAAFIRSFNDALDSAHRQRLAVLAAHMIDTRGSREDEDLRRQILWDWMISVALPTWLAAANRQDLAASVAAGRAGALEAAIAAMDSYGHALVRPVDDHRTAETVSGALGTAGVTGACLAGRDAADGVIGPRARRHWEAARVLARTAVWSIAEADPDPDGTGGSSPVWRTACLLRDSALVVLDHLVGVTAPPPPPASTATDGAERLEPTESTAV